MIDYQTLTSIPFGLESAGPDLLCFDFVPASAVTNLAHLVFVSPAQQCLCLPKPMLAVMIVISQPGEAQRAAQCTAVCCTAVTEPAPVWREHPAFISLLKQK